MLTALEIKVVQKRHNGETKVSSKTIDRLLEKSSPEDLAAIFSGLNKDKIEPEGIRTPKRTFLRNALFMKETDPLKTEWAIQQTLLKMADFGKQGMFDMMDGLSEALFDSHKSEHLSDDIQNLLLRFNFDVLEMDFSSNPENNIKNFRSAMPTITELRDYAGVDDNPAVATAFEELREFSEQKINLKPKLN